MDTFLTQFFAIFQNVFAFFSPAACLPYLDRLLRESGVIDIRFFRTQTGMLLMSSLTNNYKQINQCMCTTENCITVISFWLQNHCRLCVLPFIQISSAMMGPGHPSDLCIREYRNHKSVKLFSVTFYTWKINYNYKTGS